jgi:hypothetical protein
MRELVACTALLLGCSGADAPGVLIEVNSDVAASRFELLYSLDTCSDCTHIVPPATAARLAQPILGTGWKSADLQSFSIALDTPSDVARFQLETPQSEPQIVKRALVVALDGTQPAELETVLAVATFGPFEIPSNDSVKFEVPMRAADPLGTASERDHAALWRQRSDLGRHTACAIVEHEGGNEFFVPKDDTDCDDPLPVAECDPFAYYAVTPPTLDRASCPATDNLQHCYLGGPPCREDGMPGTMTSCAPVAPHYCIPQYLCGGSFMCGSLFECLQYLATGTPYGFCDTQANNGMPCAGDMTSAVWSLHGLVSDTGGSCASIQIASLALPITFGDSIEIQDSTSLATFTIDQASFDPSMCTIAVRWTGAILDASHTALVKIVTNNQVNRVVPWRIKMTNACSGSSTTMTCDSNTGATNDSFYTCQ